MYAKKGGHATLFYTQKLVAVMSYLPILLSVKRGAFRADTPHPPASDTLYRQARVKALKRDDYTCRFCGFKHEKNEVHHANDDHEDHSEANLITSCVLCHMCHHIGFAGVQNRGKLIYLPGAQVDQAGLNQLVRMLWIAEHMSSGDLKNTAATMLSRLDRADIPAASLLGTSNPSIMADFMSSLPEDEYQKRGQVLQDIFLLPTKQAYLPYLKVWIEGSKSYKPSDWVETARQKFAEWRDNT